MWSHEDSKRIKTVKHSARSKSLNYMTHTPKLRRLSLRELYSTATELLWDFSLFLKGIFLYFWTSPVCPRGVWSHRRLNKDIRWLYTGCRHYPGLLGFGRSLSSASPTSVFFISLTQVFSQSSPLTTPCSAPHANTILPTTPLPTTQDQTQSKLWWPNSSLWDKWRRRPSVLCGE